MPVPKPNEDKKGFISRCIPYVKREHPDWKPDKCVAVCHSIWREKHPSAKSKDNLAIIYEALENIKKSIEDIRNLK